MPITTKPEILSPRQTASRTGDRVRTGGLLKDENLDLLSHLLDDFIRIPGTPIRFGLDGIAGFIPGIGDVIGGLASSIIILAAWMRGVPYITVLRMVVNVGIETAVGSIPVLGDAFDIYWRANRRNYALLAGSLESPRRHTVGSWLFLAGLCIVLTALMLAPAILLGWLLFHLFHVHPRGL
ncbi:protein of unknown function [Granulicella rosea]|uniref:DUF4112 domain-containing protein n=1 Tax=Granulicella rosea TaxID=474952 RepID=A0A239CXP2_9BACT|nr:DUF4112 domain-containing protein [Granulicella rosea]SNS24113.1 protein of unknown function [Granulicella rosea]